MAEEQEKKDQERLENISKQSAAAKELASTYERIAKAKGQITAEDKESISLAKQISELSSKLEKSINQRLSGTAKAKDLAKTLKELEAEQHKNAEKFASVQRRLRLDSVEAADKGRELAAEENRIQNILNTNYDLQQDLLDDIDRLKNSTNATDQDLVRNARNLLKETKAKIKEDEKSLQKTLKQVEEQNNLVKAIGDTIEANKKNKEQLEEEVKLLKKATAEKQIQEGLDKVANSSLVRSVTSALSFGSILKFIIDAFFKVDKQVTNLSRSLGVSKESAEKMNKEMVEFQKASKDSFINVDRLHEAQAGLTEQLGMAVDFGNKERETFARLTEIVGLTADEAGNLAEFSAAAGKSTGDYVASIRKAAFYAQQTTKTHFSDKQILQEVSKLSAGILVKFQNNPKAIAEAVVQAKKLGTNLQQIDKIGDSLLDWESSIENELKAELITGKQINLEKARYAALTGDQVTLMNELADQVGSLADYQNMNVIAQKSLAEAFGMSREEMSEMLLKQEAINAYGSEAAKLNAQQLEDLQKSGLSLDAFLKQQDEQRDKQQQFQDAIQNLVTLLQQEVAPHMKGIMEFILSMIKGADKIKYVFMALGTYLGATFVLNVGKALAMIGNMRKASVANATASIVDSAFKSSGWMPVVGMGIAAAAVVGGLALLYSSMSKADAEPAGDISSPAKGKTVVSTKEGGLFELSPNDDLIASPGIARSMRSRGTASSQQAIDTTPLIALNAVLNRIEQRGIRAYVDGKEPFSNNITTTSRQEATRLA